MVTETVTTFSGWTDGEAGGFSCRDDAQGDCADGSFRSARAGRLPNRAGLGPQGCRAAEVQTRANLLRISDGAVQSQSGLSARSTAPWLRLGSENNAERGCMLNVEPSPGPDNRSSN